MRRLIIIVMLGCIALSTNANSQDRSGAESVRDCQQRLKSHLKCFAEHARGNFAFCALTLRLELLVGDPVDKGEACVNSAKNEMPSRYQAAMKYLSKNQKGQAMLKDAYALWLAGMNGLIPTGNRLDYERRTKNKEIEIDQVLARLELEE